MTEVAASFPLRRIIAAVDATPVSLNVLNAAAELAAGSSAALTGIFVEDINLLRLAGLSFVREVVVSSAAELHLSEQRMVRVLRGQSAHVQQAVVEISSQRRLQGALQVIRGPVVDSLLQASQQCDLLIIGKGRAGKKRTRDGTVAHAVAAGAACSVLLIEPDRRQQPVISFFDGTVQSQRCLVAAAYLARFPARDLWVLVVAHDTPSYRERCETARRCLGAGNHSVRYQQVSGAGITLPQRIMAAQGGGVAVMDARDWRELARVRTLMGQLDGSLLLVN